MKQKAISILAISVFFVHLSTSAFSNSRQGVERQIQTGDFPFRNVSLPWEDRVNDLVNRLTLEEIQDQMAHGGAGGPAKAIERLGVGQYQWATECLRGDVAPNATTAFPQPIGLAAAFSPDLIFRLAEAIAVEVRGRHNDYVKQGNFGVHTGASCFAPVINIMRDSRWGRNQETYGEDPLLSGVYAANYIKGLQGNDTRYVRASGGCKHFDVYAGPENIPENRFSFNAQVTDRDWRTTFLPAFRMCVEAGTYNLMCSYNRVNGVPACASRELLTDILRTEWGFKGYVVSDGGALDFIISDHHYFNNPVETAVACINAGCNLELGASGPLDQPVFMSILEAIKQNLLKETKLREMVAPLFYTRMRLGEFDPPEMNPYSKLSTTDVLTPEHKALAVEAAMKSFVLLKNNGVLPLKQVGTIGVVGPMADSADQLFGDYNPVPPPGDVTTPLAGLAAMATKTQYASGCNDTNCNVYNSSVVLKAISGTDINFVVLGTGQAVEREGHDRPDIELAGKQKNLFLDVISNTPSHVPVVLLVFSAGPVNISFADQDPRVSAIMECFFPAQATGEALRHVLLNDVKGAVPAGRLPYTWPLLATQLPPMVDYSMQGRTYRYFAGEPLYPFGYGLSYTTFAYPEMSHQGWIHAGDTLKGYFVLRNMGHIEADEVAQVYISWRNYTTPSPRLQLAWFNRITVPVGGKGITVDFEIDPKTMAVWHSDGWYIEAGIIDVYVGGQQPRQNRKVPSNELVSLFEISGAKYLGQY
ncbi:uncharacterized protein [Littorina saxatilis]|uniref:Fibronectin type III-like domain-containing protein n=1 Tax=Littorina saxatilis TaxID=31220 RepID=A0AAN9BN32_9CAEN